MLSFALYLIGSMVCIAGLAWIATLLGAAQAYVTAIAALLFAAALVAALAHKREREDAG
jgi:sugar phosphate permease